MLITRDAIEVSAGAPYNYADGIPLNAIDPTGRCWSWIQSVCDGVSSLRLPDYVAIDAGAVFPVVGVDGIGGSVKVTVSRHGQVYLGPALGGGIAGEATSVCGVWINQVESAKSAQGDNFHQGPALNVNGYRIGAQFNGQPGILVQTVAQSGGMVTMPTSDMSRALLAVGLGQALLALSAAGRTDRFIAPIVDALVKAGHHTDLGRAMAASRMRAVLAMSMVLGALIVVLGVVALLRS